MIADIVYPIFTLKITVLACFIQKKNRGPCPHQAVHHLGPPGGLAAPLIPPGAKHMHPYFF